jgi:drug/metabolite transporter (DMT)-like permease
METLRPGAIPATMRGRLGLAALLIVAGGGDSLGNLFFLLSSQESGVAVAAVFTSVAPVTTVVFAAVLLKERVRPLQAVGIALAAIGTVAIALGGVPLS